MSSDHPIQRFRAIAVVLLFAAALLAGSVDAVACEPELENSEISFVVAKVGDQSPSKSHSERGGDACVHGHCHAGSQVLASSDPLPTVEPLRTAYNPVEPSALGPPVSHTDERPPRA
jgi:hypothetical protein